MALTAVGTSTAATPAPDKIIKVGVNTQATMYTVPAGRKFIGTAVVGANGSASIYMSSSGTTGGISGSTSGGVSWDLYLPEKASLIGQYAGISGIESDA